ncbi:MAG: hypothetical protein IJX24_02380 [Oscillospiraceae bacterium]|nr:hypothetical protein [Oscillospiraceae bacterium]
MCRLNRQIKITNTVSKGTLFLAKRPFLKNSPLGCFVNSPLVNAPLWQGISPSADGDEWRCPSTLQAFEKA